MSEGTKRRALRVDDTLWNKAQAIAEQRGENLSEHVLRPALVQYVERHTPAEDPK